MSAYQEAVAEGYVPGSPGASGMIDRDIAEREPCESCGGKVEYCPLMKGESYRAFAICTECGEETEF